MIAPRAISLVVLLATATASAGELPPSANPKGVASAPSAASPPDPAANFDVEPMADGVWAVVRRDSPGLMVDANGLFIVNDEDVVVVDSSGAPSTARNVIAALRRLTDKPVRYLVTTHWHDDHIAGVDTWRRAFPGLEVISHEAALAWLPTKGARARQEFLDGAPGMIDFLRDRLSKNLGLSGGPIGDDERIGYENDVRLAGLAVAEGREVPLVLPTLTLCDRLTIHRGARTIEILSLGAGHTEGDLVVHLPEEGIVATGDLVGWPVPLVGAEQSSVVGWGSTLARIAALRPRLVLPGHGPILRDDTHLRRLGRMFESIASQVRAARAGGATLEAVRQKVDLEEFRTELAGDSPIRNVLFRMYVAGPAVAAAYRELGGR